ncbi:MAG: carbohydrate kinase family protein [bacterium]|nr:carbohydrate kinase family protein [bacterium]
MFDVITLGSATKDIFLGAEKLKRGKDFCFPLGEKIEIENVRFFSGGGGINTASTFARQGLKTAFCGVVGEDPAGTEIIKELAGLGVDTELLKVKKGKSTDLGLIFHAQNERTIILHHGISRSLGKQDIDWSKLKETKWFYLAPLWGKAAKLTVALVDFAKENKIKTALNPSLDQLSLPNIKEIIRDVDVLILNDDEASFLTGVKPFKEKAIFQKLSPNCLSSELKHCVVVTRGKKGALACDGKFIYNIPAPLVKVIDTTGAGDSFGSGFVAGLIQTKRIEKAMQLGMANAISNIQVFGANQGLLKKNQPSLKIKTRKTKWSV